ncbi:MAG: hypothetical protein A3A80_02030 [Candidatus Terrybacteria bacterium RIFCSPLOWO2_01_FULL_44_24]|uniref:Uncharacterized protein n=1 Tax=Candidatus Terrybacteria bacterium RIFCSPHIGHO2_01_FULL_43_35 TaxID=1802361 RepID=A0A1G2PGA3_9BACT|nr:MAG: hypothetical protein A2828_01820 [Candidatus Terrybacteria bacterium RIFCSPHIGHO2_01_FULL_43_35]OHA50860.1 MAG: hypothetical protein A3A80_02030 [Candidatus Terrybacteria bacterium RIFCSPLOWO2_01_FULL_44_24]
MENTSNNQNSSDPDKEYLSIPPNKLAQICLRYEKELVQVKDWMFWFLMLWTFVILLMEWTEFFFDMATPHTIQAGYIVLLGAYIVHKETLRWTGVAPRVRRGEIFVYIWWGTLLIMFIASYLTPRWNVPESMTALCYETLAYFLFTEFSKALNAWRGVNGNNQDHK